MNFYWVYDLPNGVFGVLTVALFCAVGLAGLFLTRKWVKRLHGTDMSHNDIVGFFLSAIMVLYGITLGLVAAGTWTTLTTVQDRVSSEAQVVASLYRDANSYEEPLRTKLQTDLKDYVHEVITVSWPQQQKGIVPSGSGVYLDRFQKHLSSFDPKTLGEQVTQAEVFKQYNILVEYRRARINSVTSGLPISIWFVVIFGGLLCIVVTLFFDSTSFQMHFWMTTLLSLLIGLMVFLVGTLDCPFRGSVSVKSTPLEGVYQQLLKTNSSNDSTAIKDKL